MSRHVTLAITGLILVVSGIVWEKAGLDEPNPVFVPIAEGPVRARCNGRVVPSLAVAGGVEVRCAGDLRVEHFRAHP